MTADEIHSMVLASDYRVPDPDRVWPLLQRRTSGLAGIGAHHVLVYKSTHDYGRVLVLIGVRSREPIVELLRSRVFFDWFDAVGVEDIPAVFAGEIVEKFDSTPSPAPSSRCNRRRWRSTRASSSSCSVRRAAGRRRCST